MVKCTIACRDFSLQAYFLQKRVNKCASASPYIEEVIFHGLFNRKSDYTAAVSGVWVQTDCKPPEPAGRNGQIPLQKASPDARQSRKTVAVFTVRSRRWTKAAPEKETVLLGSVPQRMVECPSGGQPRENCCRLSVLREGVPQLSRKEQEVLFQGVLLQIQRRWRI